jgi:hypothetical protein
VDALRFELRRLARGCGNLRALRRATRVHRLVLVAAVALAFVHRAILPLPAFSAFAPSVARVVLVALGLVLVGPFLVRLLARAMRPAPGALARRLDDAYAWRDETSTAADVCAAGVGTPVGVLLVQQAAGRVGEIEPQALQGARRPRRWVTLLLVALFVCVLLLPGVDGLLGERGGGRGEQGLLGRSEDLEPVGPPRPMKADFWMRFFVENPLPVEPLPEPSGAGEGR